MGPAIHSVKGYKYYVSLLDDFCHFTWIYLIEHKFEVYSIFLNFQKHVEHLLNTKNCIVQSDWGGEYQRLHSYLTSVGISLQVSCPRTHQLNGVLERKHRHIVETGLALIAQASMPVRFWDKAFLTANRLPSRVLANSTPVQLLLNRDRSRLLVWTFRLGVLVESLALQLKKT